MTDLNPAALADLPVEEQLVAVVDALGLAAGTIYDLEERLHGVDKMLDERGWHQLFAHDAHDGGLTLSQIKFASAQLRELVAGNPLLKRALLARQTYVWGGGVGYSGWSATLTPVALTAAVRAAMQKPLAKRTLFSNTAHAEFESAAFTDGNLFLLFDDRGERIQRVILEQIKADMRDPDDQETIWMFRRQWNQNPAGTTPTSKNSKMTWYYTDLFTGPRASTVEVRPGVFEPIDTSKTIVHVPMNKQLGWAYGVPDALPVIAWLRLYREFLTNGFVMSKALAQIAFKMSSTSAAGGSRLAAEVALPGQGGNAVSMGAGQDMSAMATAGRGYDFTSGKPLAATIAAGIGVSVDTLLASGAATELDIDTRAAAQMRRLDWDDAYERFLARLGNTRALRAVWRDLPIEQIQRQMQAWTLARNSGAFAGEVVQSGMARTLQIADPGALPDYYDDLLKGTDSGATTGTTAQDGKGTTGAAGATAGTGQGKGDGNPTGNTDTRTQDPSGNGATSTD